MPADVVVVVVVSAVVVVQVTIGGVVGRVVLLSGSSCDRIQS